MAQVWIENARHFIAAIQERVVMDPYLLDDSIKTMDGIYLDFCKALELDPDDAKVRHLAWTMAFVGLRVADNRFKHYLKDQDWKMKQGLLNEDGTPKIGRV